MGDKKRTSLTLDSDLFEDVSADSTPFSHLVNKWAQDYYREEKRPMLERVRIEQWEAQLDQQEMAFEALVEEMREWFDDQRELLAEAKGSAQQEMNDETEERIDGLHDRFTVYQEFITAGKVLDEDRSPRDPDDAAIIVQAENLNITPERLATELKRRDEAALPSETNEESD